MTHSSPQSRSQKSSSTSHPRQPRDEHRGYRNSGNGHHGNEHHCYEHRGYGHCGNEHRGNKHRDHEHRAQHRCHEHRRHRSPMEIGNHETEYRSRHRSRTPPPRAEVLDISSHHHSHRSEDRHVQNYECKKHHPAVRERPIQKQSHSAALQLDMTRSILQENPKKYRSMLRTLLAQGVLRIGQERDLPNIVNASGRIPSAPSFLLADRALHSMRRVERQTVHGNERVKKGIYSALQKETKQLNILLNENKKMQKLVDYRTVVLVTKTRVRFHPVVRARFYFTTEPSRAVKHGEHCTIPLKGSIC